MVFLKQRSVFVKVLGSNSHIYCLVNARCFSLSSNIFMCKMETILMLPNSKVARNTKWDICVNTSQCAVNISVNKCYFYYCSLCRFFWMLDNVMFVKLICILFTSGNYNFISIKTKKKLSKSVQDNWCLLITSDRDNRARSLSGSGNK